MSPVRDTDECENNPNPIVAGIGRNVTNRIRQLMRGNDDAPHPPQVPPNGAAPLQDVEDHNIAEANGWGDLFVDQQQMIHCPDCYSFNPPGTANCLLCEHQFDGGAKNEGAGWGFIFAYQNHMMQCPVCLSNRPSEVLPGHLLLATPISVNPASK